MSKRKFNEEEYLPLLPRLVLENKVKVIEYVAASLQRPVPQMLWEAAAPILAAIFMQPNGPEPALTVLVMMMHKPLGSKSLLIEAFAVETITRIALRLGDFQSKETALRAMENALSMISEASTSDFLYRHILGILLAVNAQLVDPDGMPGEKQKIMSAVGEIICLVGPRIGSVTPQIITTLQIGFDVKILRTSSLKSWADFLQTLNAGDIGPILTQVCVLLCRHHQEFEDQQIATVVQIIEDLFANKRELLAPLFKDVFAFPNRPEFQRLNDILLSYPKPTDVRGKISWLLDHISNGNVAVLHRALGDLSKLLSEAEMELQEYILAESIDPCINQTIRALMQTCRRYNGIDVEIQVLCCDCLGALGAIDPARVDVLFHGSTDNDGALGSDGDFATRERALWFATSLIERHVAPACRSAPNTRMQDIHAVAIQRLLQIFKFTPELADDAEQNAPGEEAGWQSILRKQWMRFSPIMRRTIRPLISGQYQERLPKLSSIHPTSPLFPRQSSFKEWMQTWTVDLIRKSSNKYPRYIFSVCKNLVLIGNIDVAEYILPHLVLNVLVAGADSNREETVFSLVDYLTRWLRFRAKETVQARPDQGVEKVQQFLRRVPQSVMADAAYRCNGYARAYMHFENHVRQEQERGLEDKEALQGLYAHLQKLYAPLDEPDGMEGIFIKSSMPTLDQQILAHESAGRWTDAQTCYEVSLRTNPDNHDHQVGLLNCLKNLGHLETSLNCAHGTAALYSQWSSKVNSYLIEAAWRLGKWEDLDSLLEKPYDVRFETALGGLLHALRAGNDLRYNKHLQQIRRGLMEEIAAASMESYKRGYDSIIKLHMLHEITSTVKSSRRKPIDMDDLFRKWEARLERTMPLHRVREPILSLRRITVDLCSSVSPDGSAVEEREVHQGTLWIQTAKLSRKTGLLQAAYRAALEACKLGAPGAHLEQAKLLWNQGEQKRAMFCLFSNLEKLNCQLANAPVRAPLLGMRARTQLLLSRWMEATGSDSTTIFNGLRSVVNDAPGWDKGAYYLGRYYDKLYRGEANAHNALGLCKYFCKALMLGTHYIYQTLPRLLTVWMNLGQVPGTMEAEPDTKSDNLVATFFKIRRHIREMIEKVPTYQLYIAIPQIASRIGHPNANVYEVLKDILVNLLVKYPQQTIWLLMATANSGSKKRAQRMVEVFEKAKAQPHTRQPQEGTVADIIRSALNVSFPSGKQQTAHEPFPTAVPTISGFRTHVDVMMSLQQPRKLTMIGSDGRDYVFLCKPKDDMRKDCRLMEFNSVINRVLKKDPDTRRRGLYIRTYAVVPLADQGGLIEWVSSTVGFGSIMEAAYATRNIQWPPRDAKNILPDTMSKAQKEEIFTTILKPRFPPIFHEWFRETFPEPTQWLASRSAYSATVAVMSMVGYVVGLGDRHAHNIMFDHQTGDCLHVDLNLLFDRSQSLRVPEKVPFRLTHNMVDAFGITGVEGVFRKSCEATLRVLRANRERLLSVFETFVYDPCCDWTTARQRRNEHGERANEEAEKVLGIIKRKIDGYRDGAAPLSVEGLVHVLLEDATNVSNLANMFIGWAAYT
ncbi:hypothetical protein PhCBS80983_g05098 [Powellomyces hirtus]|uniref:non-specific serine/threonine protein kinase n=1 Tax=Powellomyces hirtus TaxID=109895 RepID=A0A507DVF3_9FUNG|nr:hypothetical protein PhCBS80983_g05098 [Powellomyces hirtus]